MQCISISQYDECRTPPLWDFQSVSRPYSIICFVLGGSAFYSECGAERPLLKNHLYILPAGRCFSLREDPSERLHSLFIHAYTSPMVDTLIDLDASRDVFAERLIGLLRTYAKERNDACVKKITDMLLSYASENFNECELSLPTRIKHYIDTNLTAAFRESDLERRFNYSVSHLAKAFKRMYNLTPKQYARQLLLKEIGELLRRGLSVADIAERLSFSSPENLSRFFKSSYGCSPSEFKKRQKDFSL